MVVTRLRNAIPWLIRHSASISISVAISISVSLALVADLRNASTTSEPPMRLTQHAPLAGRLQNISQWDAYMQRWEFEYGVPARLQHALIKQESGGDPNAETYAGVIDGRPAYARGLFQVVDAWGRFKEGDPFDPDTNARVGLEYLRGCNQLASGGAANWDDVKIVYDALWCYHDGQGNYERGYSSDAGERHRWNILGMAGYV